MHSENRHEFFFIAALGFIVLITGFISNVQAGFGDLGLSARSIGQGRAFVAVANDPTAVFFNPAGLVQQRVLSIHTTYARLFPEINDDGIHAADAAVTLPLGKLLTFGAGVTSLSVPSYSEYIVWGSVARGLPFNLAVGANVKLLRWNTTGYYDPETGARDRNFSKTTASFDAGVIYVSPKLNETFLGKLINTGRIQAGARVADITQPSVAENGSSDAKLPIGVDVGLAYVSDNFTLASSVLQQDGRTRLRLGCELVALSVLSSDWQTRLLLRTGGTRMLSNHEGGEIDIGFGLTMCAIVVDYAYFHPLALLEVGGSHRVSVGYSF